MSRMADRVAAITAAVGEQGFAVEHKMGRTLWTGWRGSRSCRVELSRVSRTKYYGEIRTRKTLGFKLSVNVATAPSVRHFFVRSSTARSGLLGFIYRFQGKKVMDSPPALGDFTVVTKDERWSARLLGSDEAVRAAADLIGVQREDQRTSSVYFGPTSDGGRLYFSSPTLQPDELSPEQVVSTIERVERLAEAADQVAPPEAPATPSRFERLAEDRPYVAACGCIGCMILPLIAFGLTLGAIAVALETFW